jgi:hypothetical protein
MPEITPEEEIKNLQEEIEDLLIQIQELREENVRLNSLIGE